MADIHPGSFVGDSIEEFKKLPTWGKVGVGLAGVGIVLVAIYEHNKAAASTAAGASLASGTGATDATGAALSQSPFSSIPSGSGSVPLLPTGVNPVYDSSGNLIAFQNAPPATPPPTASGTGNTVAPPPTKTGGGTLPHVPPPAPKLTYYTVQPGDNLSEIAAKLHITGGWQSLYNANRGVIGTNPNLIRPNQRLVIPGR